MKDHVAGITIHVNIHMVEINLLYPSIVVAWQSTMYIKEVVDVMSVYLGVIYIILCGMQLKNTANATVKYIKGS